MSLICGQGNHLVQSLPTDVQGNPWPGTIVSEWDVHSSFHCSQPFCSPFRCSWWFGRTQNKASTRQPGILCSWTGRPEQSTTGHSFGTYIINVQKHAQDTSFLTFLFYWLFQEYEQRPLYAALVVTIAIYLRLISCRFIIIILPSVVEIPRAKNYVKN